MFRRNTTIRLPTENSDDAPLISSGRIPTQQQVSISKATARGVVMIRLRSSEAIAWADLNWTTPQGIVAAAKTGNKNRASDLATTGPRPKLQIMITAKP